MGDVDVFFLSKNPSSTNDCDLEYRNFLLTPFLLSGLAPLPLAQKPGKKSTKPRPNRDAHIGKPIAHRLRSATNEGRVRSHHTQQRTP